MNWTRPALWFWWGVLAAAVAISVKGNVQHAAAVSPAEYRFMAKLVAGSLPVALFVMIEGVALGTLGGAHGTARKLGLGLTLALAAVVFSMSYVGLLNCVEHMNLTGLVWLERALAVTPDLLMVAATAYLMSLRGVVKRAGDDRPVTAFARLRAAAVARAEAALAVPETVTPEPVTVPMPDPVPVHAPAAAPVRARPVPVPMPDSVTDPFTAEARALIKRTGKRTPVEQVAAVLAALDDEKPVAVISSELSMGERTVREIRDARRPHLVESVG